MKQTLSILIFVAVSASTMAQVPQLMEYTAILRDSTNAKVSNREVALRFTIVLDTAAAGNETVYQEVHTDSTDATGLIRVRLGGGTTVTGSLDSINWSDTTHYLRTEIDLKGGTDYQVSGHTPMLSVPYAMHAGRAAIVDSAGQAYDIDLTVSAKGDTLYIGHGGSFVVVPGLSPPSLPDGFVQCDPDNPMVINTVTSTLDKVWLDRNLGASRVATASDDSLAYGDLYQWGRFADGHQCRESDTIISQATTAAPSSTNAWHGKLIIGSDDWLATQDDNLWQGASGTNNPCPAGFRLPTIAEWETEKNSWSNNNSSGAFASPLKLPVAGYRFSSSGELVYVGSFGSYWSSSVSGSDARNLFFSSAAANLNYPNRAEVYSVRCIKD